MKKQPLVCVVDDNAQNLKYLGNLLKNNNFDPAVFLNGWDFLKFIENESPDLILLDIMMPEMDGFEVCRRLKARFETKGIPIIFITAKTATEDIVKAFELGAVDYVTKPFNHAELLARVKTHVEMKLLRGILPICSKCKKVRNDKGLWEQVETYISQYSDIVFSHSLCPECLQKLYQSDELLSQRRCGCDEEE